MILIKKLIKKVDDFSIYGQALKIEYLNDKLNIINYGKLLSIDEKEVAFDGVRVLGNNLRVIYQDPINITIKGTIENVSRKNKPTI